VSGRGGNFAAVDESKRNGELAQGCITITLRPTACCSKARMLRRWPRAPLLLRFGTIPPQEVTSKHGSNPRVGMAFRTALRPFSPLHALSVSICAADARPYRHAAVLLTVEPNFAGLSCDIARLMKASWLIFESSQHRWDGLVAGRLAACQEYRSRSTRFSQRGVQLSLAGASSFGFALRSCGCSGSAPSASVYLRHGHAFDAQSWSRPWYVWRFGIIPWAFAFFITSFLVSAY